MTFQEGLHQQREEVDAQQCLDAMDRLEVDGRHLEVGLELREPFLDHRLPLVGVEQVQLGEIGNIRDEGEDPVAGGLGGDLGVVDAVGEIEPRGNLLDVVGVLPRSAAMVLVERLPGLGLHFGHDPRLGPARREDFRHGGGHLGFLAVAGPRRAELFPQGRQLLQGLLDPSAARDGVRLGLPQTVIPHQAVAFGGGGGLIGGGVAVDHVAFVVGLLPQRPPNDLALGHQRAEGGVLGARPRQDGDEPPLTLVDVGHVVAGRQFAVGNVEEVTSAGQLAEQVPGVAVRLVIDDVAAFGAEVQGHAAVGRDREDEKELFQVGTMVLVVAEGDGQRGNVPRIAAPWRRWRTRRKKRRWSSRCATRPGPRGIL